MASCQRAALCAVDLSEQQKAEVIAAYHGATDRVMAVKREMIAIQDQLTEVGISNLHRVVYAVCTAMAAAQQITCISGAHHGEQIGHRPFV